MTPGSRRRQDQPKRKRSRSNRAPDLLPAGSPPVAVACWMSPDGTTVCADPNTACVLPRATVQLDGRQSRDRDGQGLSYSWRITKVPLGSIARISDPASAMPTVSVDMVGDFLVCLAVTNATGLTSTEACVTIHVVLSVNIHMQLVWNTPNTDLDLHLLHPKGSWGVAPWDCYSLNHSPDWRVPLDPSDDPRLDRDDVEGCGPENINLNQPEEGLTYKVGVHYFADRGGGPTVPTIRIFINGSLAYEKVGSALQGVGHFWETAAIAWSDGTATITEIDRVTPSIP